MFKKYFYYLSKSDWWLTSSAFFLSLLGLTAIYSIEAGSNVEFTNFKKQIIFFAIGLALVIIFSLIDFRLIRSSGIFIYISGLVILTLVLLLGRTVKGTKGWLFIFGEQGFQPVELAKIALIVILSKLLADNQSDIREWKNLFKISLVALPLIVLVFLQPDFGSAFILLIVFLGMILMAKIPRTFILVLVVAIVALSLFSWFFVLRDYQKNRIMTFIDPDRDPYGSGYNIKQSIIATGSGGLFGRGLSLGPQSRLEFLPAQETDFIFAVLAEELGLVGATLLIGSIFILLYRMLLAMRSSRDDFGTFVLIGGILYFFCQSLLNIGMNIGLLPIAGVPLPLVSYGGSSLIASFIIIGLLQSVIIRQRISIRA